MDWPMKDTTWSSHDLESYEYDERQALVMKITDDGDEVSMITTDFWNSQCLSNKDRPREISENP